MNDTDATTLTRLDEGMRHVLSSLDDIKKGFAAVTEGQRAVENRVTTLESDLRHAREELAKEQERQRDNARRNAEERQRDEERRQEQERRLVAERAAADARLDVAHAAAAVEEKKQREADGKRIRDLEITIWKWSGAVFAASTLIGIALHFIGK